MTRRTAVSMRPSAVCLLVLPLVSACVALAGGARDESEARVDLVLPPPPGPDAPEPPPPAATTTTLGGGLAVGQAWSGQYACVAEPVAITVRVLESSGTSVQAAVELAVGRYEATGEYDPASGVLELSPTRWLEPAEGRSMIGLFGTVSPDGAVYEGRVTSPGCRWFSLRR